MIYLVSWLFTIFFVYYSKYQFKDVPQKRNFEWKKFGALMRALVVIGGYLIQRFPMDWQDYVLAGTTSIFLFEILINVIALGNERGPFYNGVTGKIDKYFGKYKWFIMALLIIVSLILKFLIK